MMDWHDTRYMDLSTYIAEDVLAPELRSPYGDTAFSITGWFRNLFGRKN